MAEYSRQYHKAGGGMSSYREAAATRQLLERKAANQEMRARLEALSPEKDAEIMNKTISERMSFQLGDVALGIPRGINNAARSTYNFLGSAVGAPEAKELNWKHKTGNTVLGDLALGISQWGTGFLGLGKFQTFLRKGFQKRAEKQLKEGKALEVEKQNLGSKGRSAGREFKTIMRGAVSGLGTDMLVWDPRKDPNMATFLLELGADPERNWAENKKGLWEFLNEWAAIKPDEFAAKEQSFVGEFKERLKNVGEGLIVGAAAEAFMRQMVRSKIQQRLGDSLSKMEEAQKTIDDLMGLQEKGITPDASKSVEFQEATAKKIEAEKEYVDALNDGKKGEFNVEEDAQILDRFDKQGNSGLSAFPPELISGSEVSSLSKSIVDAEGKAPKLNEVVLLDFSKSNSAQVRGHLYRVDPTTGKVGMDIKNIENDFKSDFGLPYLQGKAVDPVTGLPNKLSQSEAAIMNSMGISPQRMKQHFLQIGGPEGGLRLYKEFFELRAAKVLQLGKEAGIPVEQLYMGSQKADRIFRKATYEALFESAEKGGLNINPNAIKDAYTGEITPIGKLMDAEVIAENVMKDGQEGMLRYLEALQAAKKDNVNNVLDTLLDEGGLINLKTFDASGDSREQLTALVSMNRKFFNQTFTSVDDLAFAMGWEGFEKSSKDPRKYVEENIQSFVKTLQAGRDDISEEYLFDVLTSGDKGVFEGSGLPKIEIPENGIEGMSIKDLNDLAGTVMGMRMRVTGQLKALDNLSVDWLAKLKEGELTDKDLQDFLMLKFGIERDIAEIRLSGRAAGKTMQAMQQYNTTVARLQQLNDEEAVAELQKQLIEAMGGRDHVISLVEVAAHVAKEEPGETLAQLGKFEKYMNVHRVLAEANPGDVLDAMNDVWVNALLSGLRTHSVNNVSNIIKATTNFVESGIGAFAPKFVFKGQKGAFGDELSEAAAQKYARSKNLDQFTYFLSMSFDMLRLFFRNSDDTTEIATEGVFNKRLGAERYKESMQARDYANQSDQTGEFLGGTLQDRDVLGGAATAEKITGGARRTLEEYVPVFGQPASRLLGAASETNVYQYLGKAWDGFYQSFIRQATRKMNLSDQLFKRMHYNAVIYSTLKNHAMLSKADGGLGLAGEELTDYIIKHSQAMLLANGEMFSKDNLRKKIYKDLDKEIDPVTGEKKWVTGSAERTREAQARFKLQKDFLDPETNRILLTAEQRESLADQAMRYGDEATFQDPLDRLDKDAWELKKRRWENEESGQLGIGKAPMPSKKFEEGLSAKYADAANSVPALRFLTPFVKTPVNIWRDALAHAPIIGTYTKKNYVDWYSGDPTRKSRVIGRQMVGASVWAAGLSLAASGKLTGGLSKDHRRREQQMRTGLRPYTITFADGRKYDFSRLEPLSLPLKFIADWHDLMDYVGSDEKEQAMAFDFIYTGVGAALFTATSSTYVKGAAEGMQLTLGLANAEDGSGYDAFERWATQRAASYVPNIVTAGPSHLDSVQREIDGFTDAAMVKIWPYGMPPKRDPLFGRIVKTHERYANPHIKALTPVRAYDQEKVSVVYQELQSLYGTVSKLSPKWENKQNAAFNMEKHISDLKFMEFDETTNSLKEDAVKSKQLAQLAKNFKAPGGAPCPIAKNQSFYDFLQQYIGVRKVKLDVQHLEHYKNNIPEEWPDEEKEVVSKFFDSFGKATTGKELDLEQVIWVAMTDPNFLKIPKEANTFLNAKSYRLDVLRSIITNWRSDSKKELLGEATVIPSDNPLDPPIKTYKGVIRDFFPTLATTIGMKDEAESYRKTGDLFNMLEDKEQETQNLLNLPPAENAVQ